jgi:hypothetical protein
MPTYLDTIICEDIRPEVGNKVTLAGVFGEEMLLQYIPVALPSLAIMQRWRATNAEVDQGLGLFAFEIEWPDGQRNRFPPAPVTVTKGVNLTTLNFIFKFVGFPIRLAGEYRFRTYIDDREQSVYKFYALTVANLQAAQARPAAIGFPH